MTAEHIDHYEPRWSDAQQREHEEFVLHEHHLPTAFAEVSSPKSHRSLGRHPRSSLPEPVSSVGNRDLSSYFISPIHQIVAESEVTGGGSNACSSDVNFVRRGGLPSISSTTTSSCTRHKDSSNKHRRRRRVTLDNGGSSSDDEDELMRRLKRRRTGINAECGGSIALGPVAAPSLTLPDSMLPSSKADMREDLLSSFLMCAKLEEDDFKLY